MSLAPPAQLPDLSEESTGVRAEMSEARDKLVNLPTPARTLTPYQSMTPLRRSKVASVATQW